MGSRRGKRVVLLFMILSVMALMVLFQISWEIREERLEIENSTICFENDFIVNNNLTTNEIEGASTKNARASWTKRCSFKDDTKCVQNFLAEYEEYCTQSLMPKLANVKYSKFLLRDGTLDQKRVCPCLSYEMTGQILPNLDPPPMAEMVKHFPEVELGGRWSPSWCAARHRIAIIVPYAKREKPLQVFLFHMHTILQRQLIDYTIFIVEQKEPEVFNKGSMMNIGFVEAAAMADYDCFIFHDVDQYPIDDRNIYTCSKYIRHVAPYRQKYKYTLHYKKFFGAATAFSYEQYRQINGFSNKFFGWGFEDDDIRNRAHAKNFRLIRYPACVSKYNTIDHTRSTKLSLQKIQGYTFQQDFDQADGVNSLNYTKVYVMKLELYTAFSIVLPRPQYLVSDNASLEGNW